MDKCRATEDLRAYQLEQELLPDNELSRTELISEMADRYMLNRVAVHNIAEDIVNEGAEWFLTNIFMLAQTNPDECVNALKRVLARKSELYAMNQVDGNGITESFDIKQESDPLFSINQIDAIINMMPGVR